MKLWRSVLAGVWVTASLAATEPRVTVKQSECLPSGDIEDREDRLDVTVEGCSIRITHENVVINCCLEYGLKVDLDGSSIHVQEVDSGPPCDCICPFDLEGTIDDLSPGRYQVVLQAFLHRDPVTYEVWIPPCDGFWLLGPEIWSPMGVEGLVVPVLATVEKPIEGFSFGTTFPSQHASIVAVHLEGTVTEAVGAEFVAVEIDPGSSDPSASAPGWATCAVVLDVEPPYDGQTIPVGAGQRIANLVYDIPLPGGSVPRSIGVPFVDGLGKPPVALLYAVGGQDVVPEVQSGIIQLTLAATFHRGDANDDSGLSISDPIYLLNWLFRGGLQPPCEDAADANDDGSLDVSDAVSMLGYLFLGLAIPPPVPSGPAGPDPTPDELGCR